MATIAAVIRWADNTDQLKRNLKEGLNQIEAVRASADKMVQSLSGEKLVMAAHRSVAAISEIGGATKLTAQEAERHLSLISRAMEKLALAGKPIPDALRAMKTELEAVAAAGARLNTLGQDLQTVGQNLRGVGTSLTAAITVPLVGLGVFAAKAAMEFESSFAGVRKTVDATDAEFAEMERQLRDLATTIPVSVNELNRLGEAAGALGIPKDEIVGFARVMAELGVTTNLTADMAAESIAKIQNIFGAAGKETENFASALVALGNDGASTEQQIVSMATRIAGAGHAINMTQGEVLAFASALSSVGIEADAGGTAISRVFIDIAGAVSQGGQAVQGFAEVAGLSIKQFSDLFKTDAATAVNSFIVGLNKIKASGGDLLGTLEDLGFEEIRVRDTLLRAAGAGDLLTRSLELQKQAWEDNTALTEEAQQRFATTESQLTLLWNRLKDVAITLGNALNPAITSAVTILNSALPVLDRLATWFASLPGSVQLAALAFVTLVAAIGPVVFIVGQFIFAAGQIVTALGGLGLASGTAGTAIGGLGGVLGRLFGVAAPGSAILHGLGVALRTVAGVFAGTVGIVATVGAGLVTLTGTWDELWRILKAGGQILLNIGSAFARVGQAIWTEFFVPLGQGVASIGQDVLTWLDQFAGGAIPVSDRVKILGQSFEWLMGKAADLAEALAMLGQPITLPTLPTPNLIGAGPTIQDPFEAWEEMDRAAEKAVQITTRATDAAKKAAEELARAQAALFGTDTIARAELYVRALGSAENLTRLTDEATAKLNQDIARAIDVYRALGREVPSTLQDIYDKTRQLQLSQVSGPQQGALIFTESIPENVIMAARDYSKVLSATGIEVNKLGNAVKVNLMPSLGGLTKTFDEAADAASNAAVGFGDAFKSLLTGKGFGDLGKAFKDILGDIKTGIFEGIGNIISGGIMSLVNKGIELIGQGLKKLFNLGREGRNLIKDFASSQGGFDALRAQLGALGDEGERLWIVLTQGTDAGDAEGARRAIDAVNEALAETERVINDAIGSYTDLEQKFEGIAVLTPALKAAMDQALEADTALEMRDALTEINAELDKQKQRYNDINGLLAKYKIDASEVTDPLFKQQKIGETAMELRKDFDIAKQAGIDMNVFMRAAGQTVNDFVQSAIKMGVEVPESMREVIQVAIDAGEIFDANGNKIETMEQLGLTFGQTMQAVVATIQTVMQRLLTVLEGIARFFGVTLPHAAEDGAAGIQDALNSIEVPDFTIDVDYNIPNDLPIPDLTSHDDLERRGYGSMGGLVTSDGIVQHFDRGGKVLNFVPRGIDTVPAMLATGEGVVNRSGMQALGEDGLASLNSGRGVSAGGQSVVINFHEGAIQAGALVHQDEVEDFVTKAALKGVEKGGRNYGRFSKLVKQAS